MEVLVCWRRDDGTLCYLDVFIGLVERAGLIQPLTRAVLEQAIAFRASLPSEHGDLRLSVNISGHDLLDETLASHVII